MMSDDDDFDVSSTTSSRSRNLSSIFTIGDDKTGRTSSISKTVYVPPKQPKKETSVKLMFANVIQGFLYVDQNWVSKGKLGVGLISTDVGTFQMIVYQTTNQPLTSVKLTTRTSLTCQINNYVLFQDDIGENWSIMFENKKLLIEFLSQILLIKGMSCSMKFDFLVQDVLLGEGSSVNNNDSVEIIIHRSHLNEDGKFLSEDNVEAKPVRIKVGKEINGKAFDDCLRGLKKNSQRLSLIGSNLYNIEVLRIKKETVNVNPMNELRAQSNESELIEKSVDEKDSKNQMIERINKMGGFSMLNTNQTSAFHPLKSNDSYLNENLIYQEIPQTNQNSIRTIPSTNSPGNQYNPSVYPSTTINHQYSPMVQPTNVYNQQSQTFHEFYRPNSSLSQQNFQQNQNQWPTTINQNNNLADRSFYSDFGSSGVDFRQIFTRLNEKIDSLTEKIESKNSYPNMETTILLSNIQRIVKENETMKKELFDRSSKIDELNGKISDLLDRNQKLIEQTHQSTERSIGVVTNVSEQTAQKILELEKQKVDLTNQLSQTTSKIADLQLQIHQTTQNQNDSQTKFNSLLNQVEQYKEQFEKSESQRLDLSTRFDSVQEQLKNEKSLRQKLQSQFNLIDEELNEKTIFLSTLEKEKNDRKIKQENERKRWQNELDELKQTYENELDELRNKLRKQRTTDNLNNNQEISRIEQDIGQQFQEKFDRQKQNYERSLANKEQQYQSNINDLQSKIEQLNEQLQQSNQQNQDDQQQINKLEDFINKIKEKYLQLNNQQQQNTHDQIKRAISYIFQRLKQRIKLNKQFTGEIFLGQTLEIFKKSTLKILSSDDNDQQDSSSTDEQSDNDEQAENHQQSDNHQEQQLDQTSHSIDIQLQQNNQDSNNHTQQLTHHELDQTTDQFSSTDTNDHSNTLQQQTSNIDIEHHQNTSSIEQNQIDQQQNSDTDENTIQTSFHPLSTSTNDEQTIETTEYSNQQDSSDHDPSTFAIPQSTSTTRTKQTIPLMNTIDDDSDDELFK